MHFSGVGIVQCMRSIAPVWCDPRLAVHVVQDGGELVAIQCNVLWNEPVSFIRCAVCPIHLSTEQRIPIHGGLSADIYNKSAPCKEISPASIAAHLTGGHRRSPVFRHCTIIVANTRRRSVAKQPSYSSLARIFEDTEGMRSCDLWCCCSVNCM